VNEMANPYEWSSGLAEGISSAGESISNMIFTTKLQKLRATLEEKQKGIDYLHQREVQKQELVDQTSLEEAREGRRLAEAQSKEDRLAEEAWSSAQAVAGEYEELEGTVKRMSESFGKTGKPTISSATALMKMVDKIDKQRERDAEHEHARNLADSARSRAAIPTQKEETNKHRSANAAELENLRKQQSSNADKIDDYKLKLDEAAGKSESSSTVNEQLSTIRGIIERYEKANADIQAKMDAIGKNDPFAQAESSRVQYTGEALPKSPSPPASLGQGTTPATLQDIPTTGSGLTAEDEAFLETDPETITDPAELQRWYDLSGKKLEWLKVQGGK
jgi:hypothetical protein